jgi:hypothetical protein
MVARRVTFSEHEEAQALCAKIRAKHPDIDERLPNGLYPYQVSSPEAGAVRLPCVREGGGSMGREEEGQGSGSDSAGAGGREVLTFVPYSCLGDSTQRDWSDNIL